MASRKQLQGFCVFVVVIGIVSVYTMFVNSVAVGREKNSTEKVRVMNIQSNAFKNGEMIPSKYSCDGEDISPQLSWSGAPAETKSYVLICDDPDAPAGTWVHWLVFNIPANITSFEEGFNPKKINAVVGVNSWGAKKHGFGGACPPNGTHRYYFKIYALDCMLDLDARAVKQDVINAMDQHLLAEGALMGRYSRG